MEWHRYNPETFEYEHKVTCQPNPARPGEFLIPPSATPKEPPIAGEKQVAVFDPKSDQWSIKPDYRGTEYWLPDGANHKIEKIGETLPEEALLEPPPPSPEDQYAEMISQRNAMLNESDWTVIRHKDQLELKIDTTLTQEQYTATLQWRQQLRDMPKSFGAYTGSGQIPKWTWPPIPPVLEPDFPDYPPKT